MSAPFHVSLFRTTIALTIFLNGCIWDDEKILPESTGNAGDVVVVMDSSHWAGDLGLQIRKCFSRPQEGLPQSEPLFNVISVTHSDFGNIFKTTRNVIYFEKDDEKKESFYALKENLWANNQLVLIIHAGEKDNAASILANSCDGIVLKFQEKEWMRLQKAYVKLHDENTTTRVREICGIKALIPSDYKIASEKERFVWLRKDFNHQGHQVNMGLLIYTNKYDSVGSLDPLLIMEQRNEMTKVIEGPVPGSYMSSYREYKPAERELNISNTYVLELRGLWNMKGAFMGGPFVHYTFVDKEGENVVNIDGYVFAPKFDKREYLRELEAIATSAL